MSAGSLAAAGVAAFLAADAWLARARRQTVSQLAREHPLATGVALAYLAFHFYRPQRLRRVDPLSLIGDRLAL